MVQKAVVNGPGGIRGNGHETDSEKEPDPPANIHGVYRGQAPLVHTRPVTDAPGALKSIPTSVSRQPTALFSNIRPFAYTTEIPDRHFLHEITESQSGHGRGVNDTPPVPHYYHCTPADCLRSPFVESEISDKNTIVRIIRTNTRQLREIRIALVFCLHWPYTAMSPSAAKIANIKYYDVTICKRKCNQHKDQDREYVRGNSSRQGNGVKLFLYAAGVREDCDITPSTPPRMEKY
ncbi:hypothetical protein CBL_07102 [Carabus blaptoides fortunei]